MGNDVERAITDQKMEARTAKGAHKNSESDVKGLENKKRQLEFAQNEAFAPSHSYPPWRGVLYWGFFLFVPTFFREIGLHREIASSAIAEVSLWSLWVSMWPWRTVPTIQKHNKMQQV